MANRRTEPLLDQWIAHTGHLASGFEYTADCMICGFGGVSDVKNIHDPDVADHAFLLRLCKTYGIRNLRKDSELYESLLQEAKARTAELVRDRSETSAEA